MAIWDEWDTDDIFGGASEAPAPATDYGYSGGTDLFAGIDTSGPQEYAGVSRNWFMDSLSNLARGSVAATGLVGHALDQFNIETGLEEWAKNADQKYSFLLPDIEEYTGEEGWFKRSAMGALQSAPATLAPFAAGALGAVAGGPIGGGIAGLSTLVGMFGAGTYNQTYRDAIEDGVSEEKARQLALETAGYELGTEAVSDLVAVATGGLLGAPVKGATKTLFSRQNIKSSLENILQLGPVNMARRAGTAMFAETGSEALNAYLQNSAQRRAGLDPGMTGGEAAIAAIGPALFLSGGITLGTQTIGNRRRKDLMNVLTSADSTQKDKAHAANIIYDGLAKENPQLADNWMTAANAVIEQNGTFDINTDFVDQASQIIQADQTQQLIDAQVKDAQDVLVNPEKFIAEQLSFGNVAAQRERLEQLAADNAAIDEKLSEYEPEIPGAPTQLSPIHQMIDGIFSNTEADYDTYLAEREREAPPTPDMTGVTRQQATQFGEGVTQTQAARREEAAAQQQQAAEQQQTEQDQVAARQQSIEGYMSQFTEEARRKETIDAIDQYQQTIVAQAGEQAQTQQLRRSVADYEQGLIEEVRQTRDRQKLREVREKLDIIGVTEEMELHPDIYKAVEDTPLAEVQKEGFTAIERNLPQQPAPIPSLAELAEMAQARKAAEPEAATPTKPQRKLSDKDRASIAQATDEYLRNLAEMERIVSEAPEASTPPYEMMIKHQELEDEIRLLAGKTDEDLAAIRPELPEIIDFGQVEGTQERVTEEFETNVARVLERKQYPESEMGDRLREADTELTNAVVNNDEQAVEKILTQYKGRPEQRAAIVDTALAIKAAFDKAEDTLGNRQAKTRIYQLLKGFATEPVKRELPKGFVEWDKASGTLYSATDPKTGVDYILYRDTLDYGQEGGSRWKISKVDALKDGTFDENVILSSNAKEKLPDFVRRFYKEGGESPANQKLLAENRKENPRAYTSSRDKTYYESEDGNWVVVPRTIDQKAKKGSTGWGLLRKDTFNNWYDEQGNAPKGKKALDEHFYMIRGKTNVSRDAALKQMLVEAGRPETALGEEALTRDTETVDELLEKPPTEEVTQPEAVPVKSGVRGAARTLFRLSQGQVKANKERKQRLYRYAEILARAITAGDTGKIDSVQDGIATAFRYDNYDSAPKEMQTKIKGFILSTIGGMYKVNQVDIDSARTRLEISEAIHQSIKENNMRNPYSKHKDPERYEEEKKKRDRRADRIRKLKKELPMLEERQRNLIHRASVYGKQDKETTEKFLKSVVFSKSPIFRAEPELVAQMHPTQKAELEKQYAEIQQELDAILKKLSPASDEYTPITEERYLRQEQGIASKTAEPLFTSIPGDVETIRGHKIIQVPGGYTVISPEMHKIVEVPGGYTVVSREAGKPLPRIYKTKAGVKRYVIDKIKSGMPEEKVAAGKQKPRDFPTVDVNGWTSNDSGVLYSDNGKFVAYPDFFSDAVFMPKRHWVVKDLKSKEVVARFTNADDLMKTINGATKSGYVPEKAKGTAKLYATAGTPAKKTGNSAAAVARNLESFLGKSAEKWDGKITVVQSLEEASGIGTELRDRGINGYVLGYYDPDRNTITLVADAIEEGTEADIFMHEGLHYTMENDSLYKKQKTNILAQVSKLKNRGAMADAWAEARSQNPQEADTVDNLQPDHPARIEAEQHLAEEAYAYFMQEPANRQHSLRRRGIAAVKQFLIRMGIPANRIGLTEADLSVMATKAISRAKDTKLKEDTADAFKQTQYVPFQTRKDKLRDPEFMRFFQRSKVRSKGAPVVLYNPSAEASVTPIESAQTVGQKRDTTKDSLLPYYGINLSSDEAAATTAAGGVVHGYYVRAENPIRMTKQKLLKGVNSPEDVAAKKSQLKDLHGYDSIFITSGDSVVGVIALDNNQVMKADEGFVQADMNRLKFSSTKVEDAAAEAGDSLTSRGTTDAQLSTESNVQDDGRGERILRPTTKDSPTNKNGKPRSDTIFQDKKTGEYWHYSNFSKEADQYTSKERITEEQFESIKLQYAQETIDRRKKFREKNKPSARTEKIKENAAGQRNKAVAGLKKIAQAISEGVRNISNEAYGRLIRMESDIHQKQMSRLRKVDKFMRQYSNLSDDDKFYLDQALRNGEDVARDQVLSRNRMEQTWSEVQPVLEEIRKEALETGLMSEKELQDNYFPRKVLADRVDDLRRSMEKDADAMDDFTVAGYEISLLRNAAKRSGKIIQPGDEQVHISKILSTGQYQFIPRPGAVKERGLKTVRDEQAQFYEDSASALSSHIFDMTQAIEYRKLLGKSNLSRPREMSRLTNIVKEIDKLDAKGVKTPEEQTRYDELYESYEIVSSKLTEIDSDLEQSIASYVNEVVKKGDPRATELMQLIRARLTQRGTHGIVGQIRDVGYMFTLGSPLSAITQIGDIAWSAFANNPINTSAVLMKSLVNVFSGNKALTKEFFDFSHSLGDFNKRGIENLNTQKALDKVLTASGMKNMDLFGKEVFMQASLRKLQKTSRAQFIKDKAFLFGGDKAQTGKAYDDLRAGNFGKESKDAEFVLFQELSQWQPVSLSEMSALYNMAGNGRIFYMLKSYNLKALNNLKREVYSKWVDGKKVEASKNAVYLIGALSLAGAGSDEIKDWILGREEPFSEHVQDQLLGLILVNRFSVDKGLSQGNLITAMVNNQMPPLRHFDYFADDIIKLATDRENLKYKTLKNIPVVGKILYEQSAAGQQTQLNLLKKDLYEEIRNNAGAGRSLYAGDVRRMLDRYNRIADELGEDKLKYKTLKNVRKKELKKLREAA